MDLGNGPTCFRCGEQGHMRVECRKRVFCRHCRSYNHNTKACRKQQDNTLSPTHSQIVTGYHPNSVTATINGNSGSHRTHRRAQQSVFQHTKQQPTQNQHPNAHTTERHVTSCTSRFNRRNNTDHELNHQR